MARRESRTVTTALEVGSLILLVGAGHCARKPAPAPSASAVASSAAASPSSSQSRSSMSYRDQVAARTRALEEQMDRTAAEQAAQRRAPGPNAAVTLEQALATAGCSTTALGKGAELLAGDESESATPSCSFPSESAAEHSAAALAFPTGTMPCEGRCSDGAAATPVTAGVTSAARGAFTRRDVEQAAVLVEGDGEQLPGCCNRAAVLLIFEAGELLYSFSLPASGHAGTLITKAVDVDQDGIAELLLETTTAWMGGSTVAKLASIRSGKLSWFGPRYGWSLYSYVDADFEHPTCNVLYVTAGRRPIFSLRPRPGGCPS